MVPSAQEGDHIPSNINPNNNKPSLTDSPDHFAGNSVLPSAQEGDHIPSNINPNINKLSQRTGVPPVRSSIDQPRGIFQHIPDGLSPSEHVKRALIQPNPLSEGPELAQSLQLALNNLSNFNNQNQIFHFWESRLQELKQVINNCQEHTRLQPTAFERLLRKYGHDDPTAARLLRGSSVVGFVQGRPAWPESNAAPVLQTSELITIATSANAALWQSLRPSAFDDTLERDAMAEASSSAGRLSGPFFSMEEITENLGTDKFVISRRFGVSQDNKVRGCDDFLRSRVNETASSDRTVKLSTLDSFMSLASATLQKFPDFPPVFFKRDHEAAYRQIPLGKDSYAFSVIAFWSHRCKRPVAFVHHALPFGAVNSVVIYNRVSQALTELARRMFFLPADGYFDDYWCVLPSFSGQFCNRAFEVYGLLHSILGFSLKPSKDVPPTHSGELLGHVVDLSSVPFTLRNSESRKTKIRDAALAALDRDCLSPTAAGELVGKCAFACTAIYGRVGRAALKPFYQRQHATAKNGRTHTRISHSLRLALRWFMHLLAHAPPRTVFSSFGHVRPHAVAYTDATLGCLSAVLFIDGGACYTFMETPSSLLDGLNFRKQGIQFNETLAVALLFSTFFDSLKGVDCTLYVDNIGTQANINRGFSASFDIAVIASVIWEAAAELHCGVWVERVESKANVADGPSRNFFDIVDSFGANYVQPNFARAEQSLKRTLAR